MKKASQIFNTPSPEYEKAVIKDSLIGDTDNVKRPDFITISYNKGEMDFGVNCSVQDLSLKEMNQLRIMTCVAIQQAQNMWSRHRESLPENQVSNKDI